MQEGTVDSGAFARLVEFQLENGVDQLVVNGTTGESPTTTDKEKSSLLGIALDAGASVTAGCGSNNVEHSERLTLQAQETGVKRVLLVDCYYNAPSSLELSREYYGYLCQKFPDMKFVAYVIPGRTGCELSVEDLVSLHREYPNLDTVKEATGNLDRMRKTRLLSNTICIMSGDDPLTFQMMTDSSINAAGVISVVSNISPKAVQELCLAIKNKKSNAEKLSLELEPLASLVGVKVNGQKFRNPVPFKTLMAGLGMIEYSCRKPLGKLNAEAVKHVRDTVSKVWRQTPGLFEPVEKFYDVSIEERLSKDGY
ncbi:dihydrodipicolinate synthase family protein, partial [Candidatus Micrarchaeota archaeon]|nr:dihydrodipicolinate synthase family protein [Candidatus Micrarchaeota archaeon]